MSGTEATPLIQGYALGSGSRAPLEVEEEEDGGRDDRLFPSLQQPQHRPRSWSSDRLFLALLGFAVAMAAAGFFSATKTIQRFRQPQQHQQQQEAAAAAAEGGGGGALSSVNDLARTVHGSNEPPARLDVFSGANGGLVIIKNQKQKQQQDSIISTPTAAAALHDTTVKRPGSGSSVHGLLHEEDKTAATASEGGIDSGVRGARAGGGGAVRPDGLGARAGGGGWRSNGISKNSGFSGAVGGGGIAGAGGGGPSVSVGTGGDRKPNVFFILIDDMGHGDIGYQSTDLHSLTPNLDALMSGGIKLSNYYSMSLCTPARAALMTGRYPIRYGMQYGVIVPGAPWGLPLSEKVLPEYMNEAGYDSHMVGKWHLGSYNDESLPSQRGFSTYMGYLNGEDTFYTHKNLEAVLDGEAFYDFGYGNETGYYDVTKMNDGVPCSGIEDAEGMSWQEVEETERDPAGVCYTGTYATDAFVGRAREVIKEKTPWDEEPLFLYLAHQSVHSPLGPAPLDGFTDEERKLLDEVHEGTTSELRTQFAGVLLYLDKRIGELMDFLEYEGWLENSIIVVASDNGGCPFAGGCNYPLKGVKQSVFEGGTKVPGMIWSKSHLPESLWGTSYDHMMHVTDWLPTLVSAAGGEVTGSAGTLDGVDHWASLTSVAALEGTVDSVESPRTELLYNWDAYLLSSRDKLTENLDLVQGAFRQGSWKLMVNVWCSGYYSFDKNIVHLDASLDSEVTCSTTCQCEDCMDTCQGDERFAYGDVLVNLDDDPNEAHNVLEQYPKIAARLRVRANEVVYSEFSSSVYSTVNLDSYLFWKAHGWWMTPWFGKLPTDLPEEGEK